MLNRQGRSILGYIRRMGVIEKRGVPIFESRLTPLIKDGTLRDDNALGARIVEAPPLVTIRITKEDALLHVRTKLTAFVLLDMDIGKRTKDTQVGDIWLDTKECLIGGNAWIGSSECQGYTRGYFFGCNPLPAGIPLTFTSSEQTTPAHAGENLKQWELNSQL